MNFDELMRSIDYIDLLSIVHRWNGVLTIVSFIVGFIQMAEKEFSEGAFLGQQLVVRSRFRDLAVFDNDDLIDLRQERNTVRHQQPSLKPKLIQSMFPSFTIYSIRCIILTG